MKNRKYDLIVKIRKTQHEYAMRTLGMSLGEFIDLRIRMRQRYVHFKDRPEWQYRLDK